MGGSPSAGGTTTQRSQTMPWNQYVPPVTGAAYQSLMPYLQSQMGQGLTPQEKSYYTGEAMGDVARSYQGAGKSLTGSLARSGVSPASGALTEAFSDLARGRASSTAGALQSIEGLDVQQKQQNLNNLMKAISIPGSPIQVGSTTSYAPAGGGGGS